MKVSIPFTIKSNSIWALKVFNLDRTLRNENATPFPLPYNKSAFKKEKCRYVLSCTKGFKEEQF